MAELHGAKEPKKSNMLSLVEKSAINILDTSEEIIHLANLYIQNGVIPAKYWIDAAHIAVASVNELDCVLSFNYEHINKLKTKRMTENINLLAGYKGVTICTPMEVLN